MTYLPQLRDQLVAAPVEGKRRRRAWPALLTFFGVGPLLAAGALAATGVIGSKPDPERGAGAPIPSSAHLLDLRVPDPAGGPPWGLRTVRTTRGTTCVETGRVVDGQLGALRPDGTFQAVAPAKAFVNCVADDAAGNAFIGVSAATTTSGPLAEPTCGIGTSQLPPCPAQDQRRVMYGLLGPEATAIVYRDHGTLRKQVVKPPEGAYLIVLATESEHGGFSFGKMPAVGYTVRRIDYRDAPSCRGTGTGRPADCPLVGFVPARAPKPAAVRRKLDVRTRGSQVDVRFRAPVAIRDASAAYTAMVRFERGQGCKGIGALGATDRDYQAGAPVKLSLALPGCKGKVRGTVFYSPGGAHGGGGPVAPGDPANLTVGTFTTRIR
jgi:hypothetical protein